MTGLSEAEAERQAGAALGRGELLAAFDIASSAIAAGAESTGLVHKRLLALARMGDTRRALDEADRIGLADRDDEDSVALHARLLKDLALALPSDRRHTALLAARDAYARAHALDRGYYSAINAASLSLLGGDESASRRFAVAVLADPLVAAPTNYYAAATAVEALLLLDRAGEAAVAMERALAMPAEAAMRASTLRQILMLADALPDPAGARLLATSLRPPPVLYFAGNLFHPDAAAEERMRAEIDAALAEWGITGGYGALAAGADLLFAEALIARGAELNVVLPFARDDFVATSVAPFGTGWVARFDACMARAASVHYASDTGYAGDPGQFAYGNDFAMGLACLRASHLCTEALHIALWDGAPARGAGGTAETIARWRASGRPAREIATGPIDRRRPAAPGTSAAPDDITRESRAIIFTDYAGFSRLNEQALPVFWREVMGRIGAVLDEDPGAVLFRNTWGDALYAVIVDPAAAAGIALRLQETLCALDPVSVGLPSGGGMRIALHYGPLYRATDPVTGGIAYFGSEVTQTARIEPVTPIGEVYATQGYAAFLALNADRRYVTSYVGSITLAKRYGAKAIHRLIRG